MEILGIDIGGSGIKGAIVDTATGELKSERIRLVTPQPATPEAVAQTLKELVDQIGYKGPIGCGFPARVINGEVLTAANIDKSWINVKVEDLFSKVTGQKVFVANDADVAGLAELTFGAVKDYKGPVLFLTIGTGIGSALFINGQMYPNTEFGHIKFKGDIAEHYCSDAVREREELGYKEWGERLNKFLEYIAFLTQPDFIVLGGGVSKKFEKYESKLTLSTKVVPATTLNLAGIIGAAMYAKSHLE
ncbi:MAG: ROK family protein [Succinivibrio sp.]|jgi:polyphosphate glucokinase|nr:ROK family protein [Succinivibrio sp.]MCI5576547.1 ROK family protein [Succinivibrio sp.]MCI5639012.1 ROK family protein [Succinivibrio sp.]MCI6449356.1 ROK family protein [Succinivibrio sp.]MCI7773312.1 ROK family protein [Succinivibrio sp.]